MGGGCRWGAGVRAQGAGGVLNKDIIEKSTPFPDVMILMRPVLFYVTFIWLFLIKSSHSFFELWPQQLVICLF